jgi:RNA methyltransferase, TrmH family
MIEKIISPKNLKIKEIIKLRKNKKRKEKELFLVDGLREIKEAYFSDFIIETIFYCPKLIKKSYEFKLPKIELSEPAFKKIAYSKNPDGWLALVKSKKISLKNLKLSKNPLIFVLEGLEKPGNLGAIIRTASAIEIDAVIINDQNIDPYNPNVIRASTGLVFSTKTLIATKEETLTWLKNNKFNILATTGKASKSLYESNLNQATAFVFGSEPLGLSEFWLKKSDNLVKIPMRKNLDSLNVSVSAAVFAFEAFRQRNKEK